MTTQNGTITGVTLLSANPAGTTALDSTTVCQRRSFLVMANFPAYTGSTDFATITGILTAVGASERNGKTLVLRAVVPAIAGIDSNTQGVHFTGSTAQASGLANTTTTGDAVGILANAAASNLASTSGTTAGVGVIAIVDEE